MNLAYDLYQPGRSWVHRADPRVKLLVVVCGSLVLLLTRNIWLMLFMLLLIHMALLTSGIDHSQILWVWRVTLPTVALIIVLWVLLNPVAKVPWISWWRIQIGAANVAEGTAVGLRIGILALVVFLWLFTTDQSELVLGMVALGLPYAWGLTMAMALRYLPTMAGVFRTIFEAQQARALDLSRGGPLARAKAYIPIMVAMLISALRTSQHISYALEARALGAVPRRTYLRELSFQRADLLYVFFTLAVTVGYVWARLAYGLGAFPLRLLR